MDASDGKGISRVGVNVTGEAKENTLSRADTSMSIVRYLKRKMFLQVLKCPKHGRWLNLYTDEEKDVLNKVPIVNVRVFISHRLIVVDFFFRGYQTHIVR